METYRPSGRTRALIWPSTLLAVFAVVLVAWLYQAAMRGVVGFDLRGAFVVPLLYGGALGFVAHLAVVHGHCRSARAALLASLAIALVGWAASFYWDYWHHDLADVSFGEFLSLKKASGWKSSSSRWDGGWVVFFWTMEALLVIPLAAAIGRAAAGQPYCEDCGRWTRKLTLELRGVGRDEAQPALAAGDLCALVELRGASDATLAIDAEICPGCGSIGWLSATEKRVVVQGKRTVQGQARLLSGALMSRDACIAFLDRRRASIGQKLKPLS